MAYHRRNSVDNRLATGDYCTYVTNMERMTSMSEGPHFPNLHTMFNEHKDEDKVGVGKEKISTTTGLFGRAEHVEQFDDKVTYQIIETTCEEDLKMDPGEFVRRKHHNLRTVK